ncbi:hypothetical protein FXO38_32214 [Capsicum annuum]|nr:hypothetical protein FXO38_32214 [Capsicum annuum]
MVGGVRIARWHDLKRSGVINVRNAIDSPGETFHWSPYALAVERRLKNYPDIPPYFSPKYPGAPLGFPPKYPDVPCSFPPKYPDSPPGFPPDGENDKKNLSVMVSQTLACDVVPPGVREKHNAGKGIHTSTEAHDSSSVVLTICIMEYGKENLSQKVSQTAIHDVAPLVSTKKHSAFEHGITENNSSHNLTIGEQRRGERTICDDFIKDIELYLSELEISVTSRRRC